MKHQPFEALGVQIHLEHTTEYAVDVIYAEDATLHSTEAMAMLVNEDVIYITKAQCMEFFGLMETPKPTTVGAAQIPVPRVEEPEQEKWLPIDSIGN